MRRGEVWWADLPSPASRRPVVLLSRNEAYAVRELVTVAPVATRVRRIPTEVALGVAEGLPKACVVNLDTITTIPRRTLTQLIRPSVSRGPRTRPCGPTRPGTATSSCPRTPSSTRLHARGSRLGGGRPDRLRARSPGRSTRGGVGAPGERVRRSQGARASGQRETFHPPGPSGRCHRDGRRCPWSGARGPGPGGTSG